MDFALFGPRRILHAANKFCLMGLPLFDELLDALRIADGVSWQSLQVPRLAGRR